jgi:hypothetical protein
LVRGNLWFIEDAPTMTNDVLLDVQTGILEFWGTSTGVLDANLNVTPGTVGDAGQVYLGDTALLQVLRADDSSAYLGGGVYVMGQAELEMVSFLVMSADDTAYLEVNDQARLRTQSPVATCTTPDIEPDTGGPVFTDTPQGCSWLFGNARLRVTSFGLDQGISCDDGTACGSNQVCRGGDPATLPLEGSCWEPGFYTNNRLIINSEQVDETDPDFPRGMIVEGGFAVKVDGPTLTSEDAINPRRSAALVVGLGGEFWGTRFHAKTTEEDALPAWWVDQTVRAGRFILYSGGYIQADSFNLDANTELSFVGDDSRVYINPFGAFDAPTDGRITAPPDRWLGTSATGQPAGIACGHGGAGSGTTGGSGRTGPGGTCDTCYTFIPNTVSGHTMPYFGRGGSRGGDGVSTPGGDAPGAIWIEGGDNSQLPSFPTSRPPATTPWTMPAAAAAARAAASTSMPGTWRSVRPPISAPAAATGPVMGQATWAVAVPAAPSWWSTATT